MPHFIIEYSANVEERLDLDALIVTVHDAAIATGIFPLKGLRTRAVRRDRYRIADGHPDNAFIHLVARIGHGRPLAVRREAGEKIFAAVSEWLAPVHAATPLALSFEMSEIDPDLNFKLNNLPDWLARRGADTAGSA
jgi:5-carboxymethyl-2-hydroxymuconate isomerase